MAHGVDDAVDGVDEIACRATKAPIDPIIDSALCRTIVNCSPIVHANVLDEGNRSDNNDVDDNNDDDDDDDDDEVDEGDAPSKRGSDMLVMTVDQWLIISAAIRNLWSFCGSTEVD